jgi:hypothetical protein
MVIRGETRDARMSGFPHTTRGVEQTATTVADRIDERLAQYPLLDALIE